ncbi:MAG: UbiA family prenyltransferase, partial [Thermoanaerobaculum sp.]|nr:UbiA family prenyltransferase [Thermoanaerobaculum sp.]
LGALCASLLNAASNVLNQIADLEADRINKPQRPLPSGRVDLASAWRLALLLYLVSLLPAWLLVPYPYVSLWAKLSAPWSAHGVFALYLGAALATGVYSLPQLGRTKRLGIWANLTIAVPRGVWLKVAGWGTVAPIGKPEAWWMGLIFGAFLLGASSTKDFSDMAGDRASGVLTLPVKYGERRAAWMIAPSFVLPWLLIPLGVRWRVGESSLLTGNPLLLDLLALVLTLWGLYTCALLLREPEALSRTENHPSWTHMYLMMMTAQVGFAAAYLV